MDLQSSTCPNFMYQEIMDQFRTDNVAKDNLRRSIFLWDSDCLVTHVGISSRNLHVYYQPPG